ncbi:hypothetical protein CUR178_06635 [Leishmania enriettii]|uniref:Uncharacterized protein n=1 Tax=Leishmania enriettii TaxID=5663 RepID=A0A836KTP1_LEIEN|nr:hypothetical protein CUR178_06635 [Leishmania enriettii]
MNAFLCTSCGTPACLVLSVTSALPSSSTASADSAQLLQQKGERVGALPSLVRFCVVCGSELPFCSNVPAVKQPTDAFTATHPTQECVAALHSSSKSLTAPSAMVSVATMHAAVLAVARQHHVEKMKLQQELNQLKAVLEAAVGRHPALPEPEEAPDGTAVSPHHGKEVPSLDADQGYDLHRSRNGSHASSDPSRTRSPSIVLPAYCTERPGMPPDDAAGALVATPGIAPMPVQQPAPPRCSHTLPRHSHSYDSDIVLPGHAAASDTVASTRLEARLRSVRSPSLLCERPSASAPLAQQEPFPAALRRRWCEDGERDRYQRQHDAHARLREALLQRL